MALEDVQACLRIYVEKMSKTFMKLDDAFILVSRDYYWEIVWKIWEILEVFFGNVGNYWETFPNNRPHFAIVYFNTKHTYKQRLSFL